MTSSTDLTARQRRVLRAMSHTYELAAFIARRAEVDNQGISGVLQSLERRGFVERRLTSQTDMSAPREWRLKG